MTYALDIYTGDGSTVTFNITFDVIRGDEIVVSVDGVELDAADFSLNTGFTQVTLDSAPAAAADVRVFRRTDISDAGSPVDFQDGGPVVASDLEKVEHHLTHAIQELYDAAVLDGIQGPPGPAGPQGNDGQQGPPGLDGVDGQDGAPGAPGANGTNGTSADDTAVFMAM